MYLRIGVPDASPFAYNLIYGLANFCFVRGSQGLIHFRQLGFGQRLQFPYQFFGAVHTDKAE